MSYNSVGSVLLCVSLNCPSPCPRLSNLHLHVLKNILIRLSPCNDLQKQLNSISPSPKKKKIEHAIITLDLSTFCAFLINQRHVYNLSSKTSASTELGVHHSFLQPFKIFSALLSMIFLCLVTIVSHKNIPIEYIY